MTLSSITKIPIYKKNNECEGDMPRFKPLYILSNSFAVYSHPLVLGLQEVLQSLRMVLVFRTFENLQQSLFLLLHVVHSPFEDLFGTIGRVHRVDPVHLRHAQKHSHLDRSLRIHRAAALVPFHNN